MFYAGKNYTTNDTDELCLRVQTDGDSEAMDILVRLHKGLVWSVVRNNINMSSVCVSEEDMFQYGMIGLMRAIQRHDPSIGAFSTYATWCIFSAIQRGAMNNRTTVRLPIHLQDRIIKIYRAAEQYTDKSPVDLVRCIADELGFTEEQVMHALVSGYTFGNAVSLDAPVNATGDAFLMDFVPDCGPSIEDGMCLREIDQWIDDVLSDRLKERDRLIVLLYFGFDNGGRERTLEEVGNIVGLSRQGVLRILNIALRTLRHPRYKQGREFLSYYDAGLAG